MPPKRICEKCTFEFQNIAQTLNLIENRGMSCVLYELVEQDFPSFGGFSEHNLDPWLSSTVCWPHRSQEMGIRRTMRM